jgi:FlaA1/EpsC-like NDP-sugar epimerase
MILLNPRSAAAVAHDILATIAAWYLAYWLRFNTEIPEAFFSSMLNAMLWVVPLQAVIFYGSGMYRGIWRYASVADLRRIALAVVLSTLAIALVLLMLPPQPPPVPRSVILPRSGSLL